MSTLAMSTLVKFCGLRRAEDIEYVNETKPNYAGFILSAGFKRSVAHEFFPELADRLDSGINRVGVFVNEPPADMEKLLPLLDAVQLHGDEDAGYIEALRNSFDGEIWKAVRLRDISDIERAVSLHIDKYVLDAFSEDAAGGTGKRIDEALLCKAAEKLEKPFFIAGGLNGSNIAETIEKFAPYGIDISSGTETDGVKDIEKMKEIMRIVRKVDKNV